MKDFRKICVLGRGYSSTYLTPKLQEQWPKADILLISRSTSPSFDFFNKQTWKNIGNPDLTIILFPIESPELAKELSSFIFSTCPVCVLVSSTGFFESKGKDELVTEKSPLDMAKKRVQSEEVFRKAGSRILHSAGIVGPGRNPLDWLRSKRVGPTSKFVNLVHVEDLARFIVHASIYGENSGRYIAANGRPERWKDLYASWKSKFELPDFKELPQTSSRASKRIDPSYTIEQLKIELKFPDIRNQISDL